MSLFPGEFYNPTTKGVRIVKIVFRGQVRAQGWASVRSEVRFFVVQSSRWLGDGWFAW